MTRILKIFLTGLILLIFAGCGLFGFFGIKEAPERSPQELINEGTARLEDGNYEKAQESFQSLKDKYPYSKLALEAHVKLADTIFRKKEFEEALLEYREFEKLHPKNESVPYVIYQQGMCNFLRITGIDRDQTYAVNALKEFKRLESEFPDNIYSLMARSKMRKCLISLAEHELYVARFYFDNGNYRAALNRLEYLVTHYPDLGQYEEAFSLIDICRGKLADS